MTDAEVVLWSKLRRKQLCGARFYRQKPIGDFIVDFYCPEARLVIEVDGGQHYEKEGVLRDAVRDDYLKNLDLCVLRFSNTDVLRRINGVVALILRHLDIELNRDKNRSLQVR